MERLGTSITTYSSDCRDLTIGALHKHRTTEGNGAPGMLIIRAVHVVVCITPYVHGVVSTRMPVNSHTVVPLKLPQIKSFWVRYGADCVIDTIPSTHMNFNQLHSTHCHSYFCAIDEYLQENKSYCCMYTDCQDTCSLTLWMTMLDRHFSAQLLYTMISFLSVPYACMVISAHSTQFVMCLSTSKQALHKQQTGGKVWEQSCTRPLLCQSCRDYR